MTVIPASAFLARSYAVKLHRCPRIRKYFLNYKNAINVPIFRDLYASGVYGEEAVGGWEKGWEVGREGSL